MSKSFVRCNSKSDIFFLNMEWTVTQKTLKHLHNIGQEYLECLHHMIASSQQNFPLLCCSGCANSTNFCLEILGFGYYIMHSKPKCQSSTNHKRRLTCKSSSLAKIQHLHTVCEKQSIHHRCSLCMDTRQPHFSRGVSLQLEGMNLGKSTRYMAKKEQCLNRCSYGLQHLKCEMWKHDVQGHTHLNGSKSKSFTSLQKEAF